MRMTTPITAGRRARRVNWNLKDLIPERDQDELRITALAECRRVVDRDENRTIVVFVGVREDGLPGAAWGVAKCNPNADDYDPIIGEKIATTRAYRNFIEYGLRAGLPRVAP